MADIVIYKDPYEEWTVAGEYKVKTGWFKHEIKHAPMKHGKLEDMVKWAMEHFGDRESITIIPRELYPR